MHQFVWNVRMHSIMYEQIKAWIFAAYFTYHILTSAEHTCKHNQKQIFNLRVNLTHSVRRKLWHLLQLSISVWQVFFLFPSSPKQFKTLLAWFTKYGPLPKGSVKLFIILNRQITTIISVEPVFAPVAIPGFKHNYTDAEGMCCRSCYLW